jgi:hypothetical protein
MRSLSTNANSRLNSPPCGHQLSAVCRRIKLKELNAPFNIVLFDSDDFRALGWRGGFRNTDFFVT